MNEVPTQVFLIVYVNFDEADLPDEYWEAIEKHVPSFPTRLQLPWPANVCPRNIGDEISFSNMMQAEYLVEKFEYFYSRVRGVTACVILKPEGKVRTFDLRALLYAADEGFLFEDDAHIADVLRDTGLKYTASE